MLITLFLIILVLFVSMKPSFAAEEEEEEEEDYELMQIKERLAVDDPDVRSETVDYLSYCGHPKAFGILIECLKDKDWAVRKDTIKALGDMNDRKSVKYIAELFHDEYWHVRKEAIRVVGMLGGKEAVAPIFQLLNSEDELIKAGGQKALIKIGNMAIEGMLSKKVVERWEAARTLGALNDKRPLPLLVEALKIEKDKKVREAIEEAIAILTAEPKQEAAEPSLAESQTVEDGPQQVPVEKPEEQTDTAIQAITPAENQVEEKNENTLEALKEKAAASPEFKARMDAKNEALQKDLDDFLTSLDAE